MRKKKNNNGRLFIFSLEPLQPKNKISKKTIFYRWHMGKKEETASKNALDYFSFGMPMPNRHVQGDYRYAYQGQEKDPENGMEAFELRLWDARIGRWLTTDPAGEFYSPYLGMGNNPIKYVDVDGGRIIVPHVIDGKLIIFTYQDGELYNGDAEYTGQDSFLLEVKKALRTLDLLDQDYSASLQQSKIVTNGFVNMLVKSQHDIAINFHPKIMETIDQNVYADPAVDPKISVYTGRGPHTNSRLSKRPFAIGLVHELAHAYDNAHGISSKDVWFMNGSDPISKQEQFGSAIENMYRGKMHLPIRNYYVNGVEDSLLIDSFFNTIWTGSRGEKVLSPRFF